MKDDDEKPRGFAAVIASGGAEGKERVREIARMGGRAAHRPGMSAKGRPRKRGHQWTAEEAREAGRRGGHARAAAMKEESEGEA